MGSLILAPHPVRSGPPFERDSARCDTEERICIKWQIDRWSEVAPKVAPACDPWMSWDERIRAIVEWAER